MSGRLEGKVALITGTAGGQGAAAARLFAAEGASVVGCDLDADRALAVVAEVRAGGGVMDAMAPVDLADPDGAAAWVADAVALHGRIDVLYNNASKPWVGPFEDMTWDDWRSTIHNELDLIFTVTQRRLAASDREPRRHHQHGLGRRAPWRGLHRAGGTRCRQGRRAVVDPAARRLRRQSMAYAPTRSVPG